VQAHRDHPPDQAAHDRSGPPDNQDHLLLSHLGTVGIANVMLISVPERRSEIDLRRALGDTLLNVAATAVYSLTQHWYVADPGGASRPPVADRGLRTV
jgi:hypothetical protein